MEDDLARRDFTVNAMAWSPDTGLVDCFGGRADLAAGVIRCVGRPDARFAEDALRILRAVRFAAQLDLAVDPDTAAAAERLRDTVQNVSAERIFAELDRLLQAPPPGGAGAVRRDLGRGHPGDRACIGCGQQGRWHCFDVWQHTAAAVGAVGQENAPARCAPCAGTMLLHDMAKPLCRTVGPDGAAHFPGITSGAPAWRTASCAG